MTVTKLKNGKWFVDISDGYSHLTGDRIRHRKKGFRTRKEAERYEADYRINQLHQFKPKMCIRDRLRYPLSLQLRYKGVHKIKIDLIIFNRK